MNDLILLSIKSLLLASLVAIIPAACVKRPFVPVNEGREYGNPKTPWVVSHLPESNQWALARTDHHHFFQKIICFNYPCRKMIGRRKVLKAISFEAFKKRVKKNAKKGAYDKYRKTGATKKDSIKLILPQDTAAEATVISGPAKIDTSVLKSDSLIILSEFLFETNSYKLSENHYGELDSLGRFLQLHPTLEVRVSGHTDDTGTERHNVVLSTRRAEVVAEYLIDKGATYERVYFEGFGSSRPIASNAIPEGRSQNRRVEILIRNPEEK